MMKGISQVNPLRRQLLTASLVAIAARNREIYL